MAEEVWTHKKLELLLKKKLAESGVKVKWGRKRKRSTTIGAIFVPHDPPVRE